MHGTAPRFLAILLMIPLQDSPEAAIRAAHARFNAAIAAHDTVALDRDWSDEITVIASPGVVYRRMPATVTLHPALNLATERGRPLAAPH